MLYKRKSPRKRVFLENVEANKKEAGKKPRENVQEEKNANNFLLPVPMMTEHLNHEFDIKFCTGFDNVNIFKVVFENLRSKSSQMKGQKRHLVLQMIIRLMQFYLHQSARIL